MTFQIVIPSRNSANLDQCVESILTCEPFINPKNILVIDDGARENSKYTEIISWVLGKKPFIFARNVNIGLSWGSQFDNSIVMNDDTVLRTRLGFSVMSQIALDNPNIGLLSSGISGRFGNIDLLVRGRKQVRFIDTPVFFICVMIPRNTFSRIGSLDEHFIGYGYEDNDYNVRVVQSGIKLAVYDGCDVRHDHGQKSSFQQQGHFRAMQGKGRQIFKDKWGWAWTFENWFKATVS